MSSLALDVVVFVGDPDAGAEAIRVSDVMARLPDYQGKLPLSDLYGAVTVSRNGKEIAERRSDPIVQLMTNFVRALPYVIDGESETVLLTESANGYMFEPSGDEVLFSFFAGESYEPDEFFVEREGIDLTDFGEQVLRMSVALRDLVQKLDGQFFERDDYAKSFIEFIDIGKKAFKTFKLEVERGLRV